MKIHPIDVSTLNQTNARVPAPIGERGPILLTEAELAHVAAAGSKPGASGGAGTTVDRPRPPLPK